MTFTFTAQDLIGIIFATSLYSLVFVFPGYIVGYASNLFDFKSRTSISRLSLGMWLSAAISPTLFFFVYRYTSFLLAVVLFFAFAIPAIYLIVFKINTEKKIFMAARYKMPVFLIFFFWIAVAIFSQIDLQIGNRLYFSTNSYDFTTRVAVVDAISRTGVPPVNPSYFPGKEIKLTFLYYYWYIPASFVEDIGGEWISPQQSMIASVVWAGMLLFASVAFYLRIRKQAAGDHVWRQSLLAIQLFFIGGLDAIVIILVSIRSFIEFGYLPFNGMLEGWNTPIMSWMNALTWVPHHLAAMLACMISIPLLVFEASGSSWRKYFHALIAGIAFASAVGLSFWVVFVFGIFWMIYSTVELFNGKIDRFVWMVIAGFWGLVFSAPFWMEILISFEGATGGSFPVDFYVRPFFFSAFFESTPTLLVDVLNLLSLPLNYLFELGLLSVLSILWYQEIYKKELSKNSFYQIELFLVSVSFVFLSFFRSTIIAINDLGIRGWLPLQFLMVVWSTEILLKTPNYRLWMTPGFFSALNVSRRVKLFMGVMMAVGLATNGLELLSLRFWPILIDKGLSKLPSDVSPDTHLGERTYAARLAYTFIRDQIPETAIVQNNPRLEIERPSGLYASRPMAVSTRTFYGLSNDAFRQMADGISPVFEGEQSNWDSIDAVCSKYNINYLIINDIDPVWGNLSGLSAEKPPLYVNAYYAIYPCGR